MQNNRIEQINELINSTIKERKVKSKTYKKPQSIVDFEKEYFEYKYLGRDIPEYMRVFDKFSDKKANDLQKLTVKFFEMKGAFATRINSTGIYRADIKKFVRNTQKSGLGDVQVILNGKTIYLEIKIGKDKPSEIQLKRQNEIRKAGGVYEFVHSFDEVLQVYSDNIHI